MANAINTAITMSEADKEANYLKLLDYVEKYTASHWVRFYLSPPSFLFPDLSLPALEFWETSADADDVN